jgi:hypothetical protein
MTKKIKWLKWVLFNAVIGVCIYFALFKNIAGLQNVLKFYIWLQLALYFLFQIALHVNKPTKRDLQRTVPATVGWFVDLVIMLAFAYKGWFLYAVLFFITSLLAAGIYGIYEKLPLPEPKPEDQVSKKKKTLNKFTFIAQ